MAANKTTNEDKATTVENPEKSYVTEDSKERYSVKLPIIEGEEGDEVVIVNDRRYVIARGIDVEVPVWVYEALRHKEQMKLQEREYRKKNQDRLKQF